MVAVALAMLGGIGFPASAPADTGASQKSAYDGRLTRPDCHLMGRLFTSAAGCSRTRCERPAVLAKAVVNAEMCQLRGQGDFAYGAAIDYRRCQDLHRKWVAAVNWCAANPDRARPFIANAVQCTGVYSTYVTHQETEGYYDECVTPPKFRQLQKIAAREHVTLDRAASIRSSVLCSYRPQHAFRSGRCVDTGRRTGPAGGVLLVGDSIGYRGINELAPLRRDFVLDAYPARRLADLSDRLRKFRQGRGEVDGLVVELGANATAGFERQELAGIISRLPSTVPVMLVMPYRANPDTGVVEHFSIKYGRWYARLAHSRANTCAADWPKVVRDHPKLLVDGVHPSPAGERLWADWISDQWGACLG